MSLRVEELTVWREGGGEVVEFEEKLEGARGNIEIKVFHGVFDLQNK